MRELHGADVSIQGRFDACTIRRDIASGHLIQYVCPQHRGRQLNRKYSAIARKCATNAMKTMLAKDI